MEFVFAGTEVVDAAVQFHRKKDARLKVMDVFMCMLC